MYLQQFKCTLYRHSLTLITRCNQRAIIAERNIISALLLLSLLIIKAMQQEAAKWLVQTRPESCYHITSYPSLTRQYTCTPCTCGTNHSLQFNSRAPPPSPLMQRGGLQLLFISLLRSEIPNSHSVHSCWRWIIAVSLHPRARARLLRGRQDSTLETDHFLFSIRQQYKSNLFN